MTIASGHRCIVRRDGAAAVNAAEIQSDCPRAFVQSASVRVIRNRETLFRTAMTRACVGMRVRVCVCVHIIYISAPFGRTLCPVPRLSTRAFGARQLIIRSPSHHRAFTTPVPVQNLSWLLVICII